MCKKLKIPYNLELSQCIRYGCTDEETCAMLRIPPDVVRAAKEEIKKLASLKLNEEELKERYAEIDKLAKF